MNRRMMLKDRVAFVTAAGAGIGRAGALAMAAQISETGGRAWAMGLDVVDDAALNKAIGAVFAREGRLDILHSHAGIQIPGTLEQVTVDQMDASWRLNVRAHFRAAQAAMPVMRRQGGGSIIITASNSGGWVHRDHRCLA